MVNMDKNSPEILKYVITGETVEEVNDQLNDLEIDLIKKFGGQPDSAKEVMAFVSSLRVSIMKKFMAGASRINNDEQDTFDNDVSN